MSFVAAGLWGHCPLVKFSHKFTLFVPSTMQGAGGPRVRGQGDRDCAEGRLPRRGKDPRKVPQDPVRHEGRVAGEAVRAAPGTKCMKIGLPRRLIFSKRKGLREVLFSWKYRVSHG